MANFEIAFKKVIGHEGGYVNNPNDKGGETKYGISKRAYPNEDIKNLTLDRAREIYKRDYWDRVKANTITSQLVANDIFDMAVNSGVVTSTKMVQKILDVVQDGVIGDKTLLALNNVDPEKFILMFKLSRIAKYTGIVNKDKSQSIFLLGWINRVLKG